MDGQRVLIAVAAVTITTLFIWRRRRRQSSSTPNDTSDGQSSQSRAAPFEFPLAFDRSSSEPNTAALSLSFPVYVPSDDALVCTVLGTDSDVTVVVRDTFGLGGPTPDAPARWGTCDPTPLPSPRGPFTSIAYVPGAAVVFGVRDGLRVEVIASGPDTDAVESKPLALTVVDALVWTTPRPPPPMGAVVVRSGEASGSLPHESVGWTTHGGAMKVLLRDGSYTNEKVTVPSLEDATVVYTERGLVLPLFGTAPRVFRSRLSPCYSLSALVGDVPTVEAVIELWPLLPPTWRREPPTGETLMENVRVHMAHSRSAPTACDVGGVVSVVWDECLDDVVCRSYVCAKGDAVCVMRWSAPKDAWPRAVAHVTRAMDGVSVPDG